MTTIRFAVRCMVAVVVLAAAWPCRVAFGNHYILCENEKCELIEIPDDITGPQNTKWSVEQVYSNANGGIQFVVLSQNGEHECSGQAHFGLSYLSLHDGMGSGMAGSLPRHLTSARRLLLGSHGFASLGIVKPDIVLNLDLGTGSGIVQLCDSTEYRYTSLPTDGVMALNAAGVATQNVATNAAGASGSVTAKQASSAAIRFQDGLNGSWYGPATSGQGFEVEAVADNINFGAYVMVNWFTYDHGVAGGPERQRWYTLFAHRGPGAEPWNVDLEIFQNVGGNFNVAPTTVGQKVGSATLKFTACDQGTLDYTFTDGSNRSGSIPITRLTQNVTCFTTREMPPVNSDFALSGNWYDPATSGQGITVEINPVSGVAFLTWYTYAPGGAQAGEAGQRWYTAQSTYTAGARTVAMTIYETTGGRFDSSIPLPRSTAVGTVTLAFQSCYAATLTYSFTGGSSQGTKGTIALSRVIGNPDCET